MLVIENCNSLSDLRQKLIDGEEVRTAKQEPCEDAISREDTLKAMIEQLGIRSEDYLIPAEATLYKVVKNMPPVTPQPKTGHWEKTTDKYCYYYKCSCCGTKIPQNEWGSDYFSPYCPECGAKIVEPQERSGDLENIHREKEQAYMQGYEDASKKYRQEPKTGHWINVNEGKWNTIPAYKCSECGANADLRDWSGESPFCPWCGAKMVEPKKSEVEE